MLSRPCLGVKQVHLRLALVLRAQSTFEWLKGRLICLRLTFAYT